jgi:hypothetical protein
MKSSTMSLCHFGITSTRDLQIIHLASGFQRYHQTRKEKCMPENNNDRVLVHAKARQLTAEEFQKIMDEGSELMTLLPSTPFHPDF